MTALTVMILTFNEERHIARAIDSVAAIGVDLVVIDSYSSDRTIEIARAKGATILQNKFVTQAQQFQWGLDHHPLKTPWVMRLDADEIIGPQLATEIARKLPTLPAGVVGVQLRRRHVWMGRWVRHGGRYPLILLRIWRTGHGRVEDRWMDEHVLVWGGTTVTFDNDFSDENLNDIGFFTDKHNRYATREAIEIIDRRLGILSRATTREAYTKSRKTRIKHWVRDQLQSRLPFTFTAPAYFVWRYVFQLGFLDGRTGLIYHFLQGYWYRFLVGSKVEELMQAIGHLSDKQEIAAELSRLTGQPLRADPPTSTGEEAKNIGITSTDVVDAR
jgi:glycosyltransferase involved in cell wall biosynthesis